MVLVAKSPRTFGIVLGWVLFIIVCVLYVRKEEFIAQQVENEKIIGQVLSRVPSFPLHNVINTSFVSTNPIPKQEVLANMTFVELEILYHRYLSSPQTTCSTVERMGAIDDGGWEVCLDPRYYPNPSNCLVYSFGIYDDWTFDDAMAHYGCEVHSFDPSLKDTVDHLRGEGVHFHLLGVDGQIGRVTVDDMEWHMYTMGALRRKFGHNIGMRRIDMIKMDIEGSERATFLQAMKEGSLSDVPQIAFEMHQTTEEELLTNLQVLREMYDHGLRIYMTNRNLRCAIHSLYTGLYRTLCHETYMVNVTLANQKTLPPAALPRHHIVK